MKTEINFKVITGQVDHTRQQWIDEQSKFVNKETRLLREKNSGFKYSEFQHLGKLIIAIDTPYSWRINVNTEGDSRRWEFMDEIGGFVETDFNLREINKDTADSIEDAIYLFKSNVKTLNTGLDAVVKSKEKFRGEIN